MKIPGNIQDRINSMESASRRLQNLLQDYSMVSLFKLLNPTLTIAFSSYLERHGILLKHPSEFGSNGSLSIWKNSVAQFFLLSFMTRGKNWPFLICYEKWQMSTSTNCLMRKYVTPLSQAMGLIDFQGSLSMQVRSGSQQPLQVFFSYLSEKSSELPYVRNHRWTYPILFESSALSSYWFPNSLKFSYCYFGRES